MSSACIIYLLAFAVLKGLYFDPLSSYTFGLVLPCLSIVLLTMILYGLLLIGNLLANPLGPNKESFAICHFVNFVVVSSLEAVVMDSAPTLARSLVHTPSCSGRASARVGLFDHADRDDGGADFAEQSSGRARRLAGAAIKRARSGSRRPPRTRAREMHEVIDSETPSRASQRSGCTGEESCQVGRSISFGSSVSPSAGITNGCRAGRTQVAPE